MSAIVFNGKAVAQERAEILKQQIFKLDTPLTLVSFFFGEDSGSRLYTRFKDEAAKRVGIHFEKVECSFGDDVVVLQQKIRETGERKDVTGMLIQKPAKNVWQTFFSHPDPDIISGEGSVSGDSSSSQIRLRMTDGERFNAWWKQLVEQIDPAKDADGLSPSGTILPATVRAVLTILKGVPFLEVKGKRVVVIGRSDIVGKPLAAELVKCGSEVVNVGSSEADLGDVTRQADVLISATGKENLITAEMIKEGAVVIDVGEPRGDVDFETVKEKARFITPVPGGVGPMTVISLLENVVELGKA